jgi:release factor glutamine methyltransferase
MTAYKFYVEKLSILYDNDEANAIAHHVFEYVIGNKKQDYLFLNFQKISSNTNFAKLQHILLRLLSNEPLQHIIGNVEFLDCKIKVNKNVLIPRPETEELVFLINKKLRFKQYQNIIDICSGSGCIAISVAKANHTFSVYGLEKSKPAYILSKQNSSINNVTISFLNEDIFKWKTDLKFDYIISNPPYIKQTEGNTMDKNVMAFEPHIALFVEDKNPLIFYTEIKRIATESLKIGGEIFLEINPLLATETLALFNDTIFSADLINDMYGKQRFVFAIKKQ